MRRWRNLPFRRGTFWGLPQRAAAPVAPFLRQSRRPLAALTRRGTIRAVAGARAVPPSQSATRLRRAFPPTRGRFFPLPPAAHAVTAPPWVAPQLRQPRRQIPARRGQFLPVPVPAAAVPPPPWVAPFLHQPRRWLPGRPRAAVRVTAPAAAAPSPPAARHPLRLAVARRGQFLPLPPPPVISTSGPLVPPFLHQPRRWLPVRPRAAIRVTAAAAAVPPSSAVRHAPRLALARRGLFLAVPPAPPVTGGTGPLVPPHLRQRRSQPLRVPRSHRVDPPWAGQAAPPPTPPAPQIPRQHTPRAAQPRRGCLFTVPPPRAGTPPLLLRQHAQRAAQPRRGCLFRNPPAAAAGTPGPLIVPFIRPAGNRPRWPALPRRSCRWMPPLVGAPPPPFTIGTLTATGAPGSTLTAVTASSTLTAGTASGSTLTAVTTRTGGPS